MTNNEDIADKDKEDKGFEEFKKKYNITEEDIAKADKEKEETEGLLDKKGRKGKPPKETSKKEKLQRRVSKKRKTSKEIIEEEKRKLEEFNKGFNIIQEEKEKEGIDVLVLDPNDPADIHKYMDVKKIDDPDVAESMLSEEIAAQKKEIDDLLIMLNSEKPKDVQAYMSYKGIHDPVIAKAELISELMRIMTERSKSEGNEEISDIGYEIEIESAEELDKMNLCAYQDSGKKIVIQKNCVLVESRGY